MMATGLFAPKLPPRVTLTPDEELLADEAMLTLSRLRDQFVYRDASRAAGRVGVILEQLEDFARGRVDA